MTLYRVSDRPQRELRSEPEIFDVGDIVSTGDDDEVYAWGTPYPSIREGFILRTALDVITSVATASRVRQVMADPEVQRAAAALRVTTDKRLGKQTPEYIRKLANS